MGVQSSVPMSPATSTGEFCYLYWGVQRLLPESPASSSRESGDFYLGSAAVLQILPQSPVTSTQVVRQLPPGSPLTSPREFGHSHLAPFTRGSSHFSRADHRSYCFILTHAPSLTLTT